MEASSVIGVAIVCGQETTASADSAEALLAEAKWLTFSRFEYHSKSGFKPDAASFGNPDVVVATPRRKPRGQPRPPEDVAYNTAFAQRRIVVEHSIGRLRRYQALSQTDRHPSPKCSSRSCGTCRR